MRRSGTLMPGRGAATMDAAAGSTKTAENTTAAGGGDGRKSAGVAKAQRAQRC
jgi:hypothetical protein